MPHGMVGFEERRMLYWLGAEHYSGAGVIVDAGAYLGASAFALSAGLAKSRHAGVSPMTVSRVINNVKTVKPQIRERVMTRHMCNTGF